MRMFPFVAVLGLLAAVAAAIPPLPPPPPPAAPPRLLIAISVDQLSTGLFERYRPHFTGGLARLSGGAVFRNARAAGPAASSAPSIGDLLKAASPQSLSAVVAGDARSAAALGGATADQRWSWSGGRFQSAAGAPVPRSVPLVNAAVARMIAAPQPPLVPPPVCAQLAGGAAAGQPATGWRFGRAANDLQGFAASPALDGAVLALAAALTGELRLGVDAAPDLLSLDLPATGAVHQRLGADSEAMCLQLLSLDRDLGDLFRLLDRGGLDYSVVLSSGTAPAGGSVPILFWRSGMAGAMRDDSVTTADIMPTLAAMLGLTPPAQAEGTCLAGIPGIACPAR